MCVFTVKLNITKVILRNTMKYRQNFSGICATINNCCAYTTLYKLTFC